MSPQDPDPWLPQLLELTADGCLDFLFAASLLETLGENLHDGAAKRRLRRCMDAIGWMPAKNEDGTPGFRPGRYVDKKRSQVSKIDRYVMDEFGVLSWLPIDPGDGTLTDHNPFEQRLQELRGLVSLDDPAIPPEHDAAADTYDTLITAQSVAVTIFGARWAEHVFEVYDRLKAVQQSITVRKLEEIDHG